MFDLSGRTVLITGGCGQLGQQHAEAILECGGDVILADIVDKYKQNQQCWYRPENRGRS